MFTNQMRVIVKHESADSLRLTLNPMTPKEAAELRRALMRDVRTVAIDLVDVLENSSVMQDELLAHRLALFPIVVPEEALANALRKEECACETGCPLCSFIFCLDKRGPCTVFASDVVGPFGFFDASRLVLIRLGENQSLKLKATAQVGTNARHAKWSAVTVVSFCAHEESIEFFLETVGQRSPRAVFEEAWRITQQHSRAPLTFAWESEQEAGHADRNGAVSVAF